MQGRAILLLLVLLPIQSFTLQPPPLCKKWLRLYKEHCNPENQPPTANWGNAEPSAGSKTKGASTDIADASTSTGEATSIRSKIARSTRSASRESIVSNSSQTRSSPSTNGSSSINSTNNTIIKTKPQNPYLEKPWLSCCEIASHARALLSNESNTETTEGHKITSNIYKIKSGPFAQTLAYCNIDDKMEGWTVILRRYSGKLVFNRSWEEYEFGFGSLNDEFWYGLNRISSLTNNGSWELQIELETKEGKTYTVKYNDFLVEGPNDFYHLSLSGYSPEGTNFEDFLGGWSGRPFTTNDKNNNPQSGASACADLSKSGWWYTESCYVDRGLNLNKEYGSDGIEWVLSSYKKIYLRRVVAKMRQRGCLKSER